eukprot:TRINITY_DN2619_c0_g1_i1.p1 TRINITY_DN2619_c0_g1~~TRINITY_DN2619_c0_g1_i1.p1  ORF type:complete len:58 (+),score=11.57 TRINITY_DN2619_c0_g1_i1:13-186(+)
MIKSKKYINWLSTEKTDSLLAKKEASEVGDYIPPSLKIAGKEKVGDNGKGRPHIIFI